MVDYSQRLQAFQSALEGEADLAFIPICTDLEFLAGVPRDIPNYGRALHPGMWLEGAWVAPGKAPILTLPRMTAHYSAAGNADSVEMRILGDWDDPSAMVQMMLKDFDLPPAPRIAVSDNAEAQSVIALQALFPEARFTSATRLLRRFRTIKTPEAIETMRAAGKITEAAFDDVISHLKIGMTELDVIAEVDYQMKRRNSLGPSFTTTLYASGPNHPLLLGQRLESWPRRLEPPVSILFDFGAIHDGMCYDYGRTVCFGAPDVEQTKVHGLVMDAQRAGIAALKAGVATCEQVDKAARDVIVDAGYGDAFRHRLGHSIGWDVHEPPFLTKGDSTPVSEGMIFTIEPSILFDCGASARVEDCIVARPEGGEPLTSGYQKLVIVE